MAQSSVKLALPREKAAEVLSLDVEVFTDLVECGALPEPKVLRGRKGEYELWSVAKLDAAFNADNADSDEFEP